MPFTLQEFNAAGDERAWIATYTGPTSYATGGEPISPSVFGGQKIDNLIIAGMPTGASVGRLAAWDAINGKVKVFTAPGTEAGAASDQSAYTWTAFVVVK